MNNLKILSKFIFFPTLGIFMLSLFLNPSAYAAQFSETLPAEKALVTPAGAPQNTLFSDTLLSGSSGLDEVCNWNFGISDWVCQTKTGGSAFSLDLGRSYLFKMNASVSLSYPYAPYGGPLNLSLQSGENYVGFPFIPENYSAFDILLDLPQSTAVHRLNPDGAWDVAGKVPDTETPAGIDFIIKPGQGYEISVSESVSWAPPFIKTLSSAGEFLITPHGSGAALDSASLLSDYPNIGKICSWDFGISDWICQTRTGGASFSLDAGGGYRLTTTGNVTLKYKTLARLTALPIFLQAGENYVGFPFIPENYSAFKILAEAPEITAVHRLNPDGAWDVAGKVPDTETPAGIDFVIKPGEGYEITTSKNLTFTPGDGVPPPPPLPLPPPFPLPPPPSGGGGVGSASISDNNPPSKISIKINNGASSTTSRLVILTLAAEDKTLPIQMKLGNDSSLQEGAWQSFTTTTPWILSSGIGEKTVYVRFRDPYLNFSDVIHASINLEEQKVITPVPPTSAEIETITPTPALSSPELAFLIRAQIGLKGESIKYFQVKLKQSGFYNGSVSGYFEEETLAAILAFQKSRKIPDSKILRVITRVVPEKEFNDLFANNSGSNASNSAIAETNNKNLADKFLAQIISLFKRFIKF